MNMDAFLFDMNKIDITKTDLNLLKVFEALYEEGSASRAATRLALTQSAVSAALKRLRDVYGDRLFQRTGCGVAPTLLAQQLKPVVSEALHKIRQSLVMVSPLGRSFEGRSVTIGLSDDFEIAIGSRLIERATHTMPGLRLIFRQTHSQVVADALAGRNLDLAISSGGLARSGLSRCLLGGVNYACVVDPERWAIATLDIECFVSAEHILVSSGGFVGIVDEALAERGLSRRVVAATTHFAALPYLLKGTSAIATIPAHAAAAVAALTGLQVLPCPLPLHTFPIELGWRTADGNDEVLKTTRPLIEECFSPP
ncbi:LysR family transcriptional regulator [Halomonas llamarensis]|uniref:LysR family transcriptional regulator n=1 Tax=Halomonas llamarensis TaxID=2945104 RepID=A0ABT0SVJ4_9GAMM|nr:LysR family transcriptional regulator [Halomonas llamarensis]MCL7931671.1 LysR family transcriptional regulator [Halomonas llamarensis]